jgi:hypothetical protein
VTRARLGALALLGVVGALSCVRPAIAQEAGQDREALVIRVEDLSFEELLGIPEVADLARTGGAGLLANDEDVTTVPGGPGSPGRTTGFGPDTVHGPKEIGAAIREAVYQSSSVDELLVIVLSTQGAEMRADKDDLVGIVLAQGAPGELFSSDGPSRGDHAGLGASG